jgi:DedD protein
MGVLSDEDLVVMRARARHRLIGALALVVLLIIGVPLLIDRRDPPAPPEDTDSNRPAPEEAPPSPQPSSVTPLGTPAVANPQPGGASEQPLASAELAKPADAGSGGTASSDKPAAVAPALASTPMEAAPAPAKPSDVATVSAPLPGSSKDPVRMSAPAAVPDIIPPLAIQAPARHKDSGSGKDTADKPGKDTADKTGKVTRDKPEAKDNAGKDAREHLGREASVKAAKDLAEPPAGRRGADTGGAGAHGWFVQFGFFADAAHAESLAKRLESQGIHVHDEVLQTPKGPRTRLRSESFAARPDADEVLARARTLGENAFLVHQ